MEGLETIEEVRIGDTTYTMLKAQLANEIIQRLNIPWEVKTNDDATTGKFIWSREKIVLELPPGGAGGGGLVRFDVFESGTLKQYDIPATLVV